jgi:hypothetical protein
MSRAQSLPYDVHFKHQSFDTLAETTASLNRFYWGLRLVEARSMSQNGGTGMQTITKQELLIN